MISIRFQTPADVSNVILITMRLRRASVLFLLFIVSAWPGYLATRRKLEPARKASAPVARKVQPAAKPQQPGTNSAAVNRWLRGMTLREKAGQLIVATSYGEPLAAKSKDYAKFVHLVRDLRIGGLIVVNRVVRGTVQHAEPYAMAAFLNRMQRLSKIPLLVGADFERGASMRVTGTAKFPHLMAYGAAGDVALTRQLGAATAREARALGVHWVFAPDADVNNNPENPIINTRSFGEDPQLVAAHVRAFIAGARSVPDRRVLTTVKHFPGHGDTSVDSHVGLPVLGASAERLQALELVPFAAAVEESVDAVMTAHMSVPAIDPEGVPATVSRSVLTGLLRDRLGFDGLVVTDAMDMHGLAKQFPPGEAAVRALEAGADVLLMPPDPDAAIAAVLSAVRSGRLTEARITASVRRILAAKARVGLHRDKLVPLESIPDTLGDTELSDAARTAAARAVTLIRNDRDAVPLNKSTGCIWILPESRSSSLGRVAADEARQRLGEGRVYTPDPQTTPAEIDAMAAGASGCSSHAIVMAAVSKPAASVEELRGSYPRLVAALRSTQVPVSLTVLGSPYLLRICPGFDACLATFSSAPTAETAAVTALLGESPIGGRMPVSIPGVAGTGDGLTVNAGPAN